MTSSAIIIATGASPRWLGAPGEKELFEQGRALVLRATATSTRINIPWWSVVGTRPWSKPYSWLGYVQE